MTWHRIGAASELRGRVPCAIRVERHAIALFHYDGAFRAIGNACNHKGGPLCQGRMRDEYVVCPWHAWEYSVVTGRGPAGYDEEQVPVFDVEERADGVYVATPPREKRRLLEHKPQHLLEEHPKPAGAPRPLAVRVKMPGAVSVTVNSPCDTAPSAATMTSRALPGGKSAGHRQLICVAEAKNNGTLSPLR